MKQIKTQKKHEKTMNNKTKNDKFPQRKYPVDNIPVISIFIDNVIKISLNLNCYRKN